MTDLRRAVAIQLRSRVTEYGPALAALDPPATDAERDYLRDMVRRHRAAERARATLQSLQRQQRDAAREVRHA